MRCLWPLITLSLVLPASGCAPNRRVEEGVVSPTAAQSPLWRLDPDRRGNRFGVGVDVHRFVVTNTADQLTEALAPLESLPIGLDEEQAQRLTLNGLRVRAAPIDELDSILADLALEPVVSSTWYTPDGRWNMLAAGPDSPVSRVLTVDHSRQTFNGAGRFEWLMRLYPYPTLEGDFLRFEAAPEYRSAGRTPAVWSLGHDQPPRQWIAPAALSVTLDGQSALVIAPVEPLAASSSVSEPGDEGSSSETSGGPPATPIDTEVGPPEPLPSWTVGQELLVAPDRYRRTIIIIVPHLPANALEESAPAPEAGGGRS